MTTMSSRPSSSASDSLTGRDMCDDTEREMVTLGPANTNTWKSDLLEQETLGSPSGEVILNFRGPRHCDETLG